MNKTKHPELSRSEKWAERFGWSRPFDLYTEINLTQIKRELGFYQSAKYDDKHYIAETEMTPEGLNFRLTIYRHTRFGILRAAWMEAKAQPVENMESVHIHGKVCTRKPYALMGCGTIIFYCSIFMFPVLFQDTAILAIVMIVPLALCIVSLMLWSFGTGEQSYLLTSFRFTLQHAAHDVQRIAEWKANGKLPSTNHR